MITIAIVGITFTAILGGMITAITVSSQHRKQATADTLVRSAAEWVKDPARNAYANCAGANTYSLSGRHGAERVFRGRSAACSTGTATSPSGAAYQPTFQSGCPSPDPGLQRITISATAPNGSRDRDRPDPEAGDVMTPRRGRGRAGVAAGARVLDLLRPRDRCAHDLRQCERSRERAVPRPASDDCMRPTVPWTLAIQIARSDPAIGAFGASPCMHATTFTTTATTHRRDRGHRHVYLARGPDPVAILTVRFTASVGGTTAVVADVLNP